MLLYKKDWRQLISIALAPKVVLPEKGVVGIENALLVSDNDLEALTKFRDTISIL